MLKKYHGIIPPIITPVTALEQVDEEGFRALIEHCVQSGLHAIFVAGTNGETMQLTQKERERAIKIAIDQVAGRIPVVCGIMDSSTKRVIENMKALEQLGGNCAAITSIFYARHTSQNETIRHFEAISQEADMDILIYNMPSMTGLNMAAQTVMQIGEMDHIMGYKDSSLSYGAFMLILEKFRNTPFACLQGITAQAVSAMLMGADGYVPALAPLFPKIFIGSYDAAVSGNINLAMKYNALVQATSKILALSPNMTAAAKFAISTLGMTDKRVLAPQDGVSPEEEQKILRQIEKVHELYARFEEENV